MQSEALRRVILERLSKFEATYSRFRPDSTVTTMATKAGDYALPADATALFALYRKLYDVTEGAVTPLIGDSLSAAGYDANYSFTRDSTKPLPQPLAWDEALSFTPPTLTIKKPTMLDFGAAGKGYAADLVANVLYESEIDDFCVDASGDFVIDSAKPTSIGLEHPARPGYVIGTARITHGSLCGSAGNRRAWGDYHHILDPHSLASPHDISAVWAYAKSGLYADGLATALFFTPPQTLHQVFEFEYVIVRQDMSAEISPGFPGELF